MKTTLTPDAIGLISDSLRRLGADIQRAYPGESPARQPVHTVYGGAHLFRHDSARRLGELALRSLREHAPDARTLADAVGMSGPPALAEKVYGRILDKLAREPVEDFRIDFEDGFGVRPDVEEDATAIRAAEAVARGMGERSLPPFIGIRVKPMSPEMHLRGLRTLDLFLTALLDATANRLPDNFVITIPKVAAAAQVAAVADALDQIERIRGMPAGSIKVELMVETTQSIIDADGRCPLPSFVRAARGRCVAAHFGVYDYTAGCSITAAHQAMGHPSCEFARQMMQAALAGTGIWLSDGATNVMPVGQDRAVVHRAWRLHYEDVRRSLATAFYQGWDLHPAQLPTRYAAVFSFFIEGLDQASDRLRHFIARAGQATLVGDIFDDAATGQALLNFFLRGVNCGALTEQEAAAAGLSLDELRLRSFVRILSRRNAP